CAVVLRCHVISSLFLNDTSTTEIYTLSLHDALPISPPGVQGPSAGRRPRGGEARDLPPRPRTRHPGPGAFRPRLVQQARQLASRSEEHTSELQSRENLVCRLLLEKKKKIKHNKSNDR